MPLLIFFPNFFQLFHLYVPFLTGQFDGLACEDPALVSFFGLKYDVVASLGSHIHQNDCIPDEVALDQLIQGSVRCETGCMVDLEQINFTLGVDHEVEPKNFETHVVG